MYRLLVFVFCLTFPLAAAAGSAERMVREGFTAYRTGDYESAIKLLNKAIDTGDLSGRRLSETLSVRGSAHFRLRDFDEALVSYSEAIRNDPEYAHAYSSRAATYNETGEYDLSIADNGMATNLDPGNVAAYNNRCDSYRYKMDFERALEDCDEAVKLAPNNGIVWLTRGQLYEAWGKTAQAVANYRKAYELQPDYPTIRRNAEKYGFARP